MGEECKCFDPEASYETFEKKFLGMDPQYGRFADVSMLECKTCGGAWLHYYFIVEGFQNSGRWYRGKLSERQREILNADNAAKMLESLSWYFAGGSYYYGKTHKTKGRIDG